MTFYVSVRPIKYRNDLISPTEQLKFGFPGINFTYEKLGERVPGDDGRYLYRVTISDEYPAQIQGDYKDIIIEGLMPFCVHLKTLQSAKDLAERLTKRPWVIEGDKIRNNGPAR